MLDRYDENLILGYIEGDLAPEQAGDFEKLLSADDELRLLVAALMRDRRMLRAVKPEELPGEMASHVHEALERHLLHAAADEKSHTAARPLRIVGHRWLRPALSAAAVIAIGGGLLAALDPWQWFNAPSPTTSEELTARSNAPAKVDQGEADQAGGSPAALAQSIPDGAVRGNPAPAIAKADAPAAPTVAPHPDASGAPAKSGPPASTASAPAGGGPGDRAEAQTPDHQESLAFQLAVASPVAMRQEILAWADTHKAQLAAASTARRATNADRTRQAGPQPARDDAALKEQEAKKHAAAAALPADPARAAKPGASADAKSPAKEDAQNQLADGQPSRGGKSPDAASSLGGASPPAPGKPAGAQLAARDENHPKKAEGGEGGGTAAGAPPGAARPAAPPPPGAPVGDAPAAARGPAEPPAKALAQAAGEAYKGGSANQEINLLVPADKIDSLVAMIEDRTGQTLTVVREGDTLMLLSPALVQEHEALRKQALPAEKQQAEARRSDAKANSPKGPEAAAADALSEPSPPHAQAKRGLDPAPADPAAPQAAPASAAVAPPALPAPAPAPAANKPADKAADRDTFGNSAPATAGRPPDKPDAAKDRAAHNQDLAKSAPNARAAGPQVFVRIVIVEPKTRPSPK